MRATIAGYTRCTYREAQVKLGRARTRCPACGAELQSRDQEQPHYIRRGTPRPAPILDHDLPQTIGEPEPAT